MAEYAGLEIRIGGNTTKLTNALKASTKSAAELQRQIRQVTRAMQFDPTNLRNIETRIRLTGDRMQSLQSKAQITKEAMKQLGDTMVQFNGEEKSIREIASETENVALAAKQADERFNKLTGSLAQIYEAWNRLSRDKGADFLVDKLALTQDEAERLMSGTTSVKAFVSELREIQAIRSDPMYSGRGDIITDEQIKRAKELKQLNFHDMFKRGLELDDVLAEAEKFGVVIEDSAIETVRDLQKTFKEAQQDKKAFDDALRFDQMSTDAQRLDSEVESLSQTIRSLDDGVTEVSKTPWFQNLETEIRKIDAALDNVDDDLKRTGEAMKVDPKNVQLAARYMQDLQQKATLSEQKVELLKTEMSHLDANGASEAAKKHQDLAKWVEESAEAACIAKKELSDEQANVANLTDQTNSLSQAIKMVKGDELLAGYSDAVLQWKKRTDQLTDAMTELGKKQRIVADEQKKLDTAQDSFDKATKGAQELKEELDKLEQEYQQLSAAYGQAYNDPNVDMDTKWGMYNRLQELESEIPRVQAAYKGAQQNVKEFNTELGTQKEHLDIAKDALRQQQEAVDDLQGSVDKLASTREVKLFENPTDELEKAEAELVRMQGQLDKAKAKESELNDAYKSAKTENELAKTSQAWREVSSEVDNTKAEIKKTLDELDASKVSILNPSTVKSLGMTFSATVTPAVTALGYKMVDASSTVDAAYRDMRKTVEGTEEQFEHLRSAAIDFSRTHVTSADQILQIEAIGGELGIATENLETFAEVISNIDVATNLDTESAAEALGHLANILHLTEEDYVGFSDALVRLGNNGASTETEIANIAERIGSMGSIVGMSGSDILALSSTIASTGQNAEAAGTAISRTMSFMETAVSAAAGTMDTSFEAIQAAVQEGGDKLTVFASLSGKTVDEFTQEWEEAPKDMAATIHDQVEAAKGDLQMIADVAHMSADDFAKAWEDDPTEVLKAFINGLNDIEGAEGSADKVLQDLGITAVRQKQAIEGLMQTVGGLDKNLKMSEDAWNGISDEWGKAGDAANEASKKAEGFSGQIQILKNMGQNMLAELGEGAVPWIKSLTGTLQTATEMFSGLSAETKKWIVAAGGIAAIIGPVLSVGATFATAGGEFKEWFDTTTSGINLVKLAFKHNSGDISAALTGTMSTMGKVKLVGAELGSSLLKGLAAGSVVAAIGVIIYGLMQLYDQYQTHIAATEGFSDAISGIGVSSESAAAELEGAGKKVRDFVTEAGGYEKRLADLGRTIEDSNRQYGTYAGQMDYYAGVIETLGGKTDRTKNETQKLEAALQAVNDQCNTNYGLDNYGNIIDTTTGKIQENNDVLRANIELHKQQALIDYYSDDYAQAIGQQADAQERLNKLRSRYKRLQTDEGHDKWIDKYIKKTGRADLAEEAFQGHLERTRLALEKSQTEYDNTTDAVDRLDSKIASATEGMNKANQVIKDAAAAQAELDKRSEIVAADVSGSMKKLSDAAEKAGTDDAGFNAIAKGLESISVSAKEMNDVDMGRLVTAFSDAGSSMSDVIATLEEGGVQMTTWNSALEQAPEAAEKMGSVTAAAFQTMYDSADSDINATMTLIAGLDAVKVNDKTFFITDNGSITDEQGKVYDIKKDIAEIPSEVVTVYYGDNEKALKKAMDLKKKNDEVGKQKPTPKIGVKDNASKPTESLLKTLGKVNDTEAKPVVSLRDYASEPLRSINKSLDSTNGRVSTVTIKTVEKKIKQATGGYNNRPVIPEHASGYIATGPTLTNQGWIGEDGVEAVANWATGGAVVPLTNKRFMLPIADAIADGMSRRMGDYGNPTQISVVVNGVASPDEVADAITRKLRLLGL